MPSKFEDTCRDARAAVEVPVFPLAAIRAAARRRPSSPQRARKRFVPALLTGFAFVGVAAAAQYLIGTHLSASSSGPLQISTNERLHIKHDPSDGEIAQAVRSANFQVELPPWVPGNARPTQVFWSPSVIYLSYNLPGTRRYSNHMFWIVLANPLTLDATKSSPHIPVGFMLAGEAGKGNVVWHIGHQVVIVPHSTATAEELAHIKSAFEAQAANRRP
jgi:hypothetical protein